MGRTRGATKTRSDWGQKERKSEAINAREGDKASLPKGILAELERDS